MRMSREAAAESKARIVATASKMLRARGLEGASIADVMVAAGMTHGGFYKHFATKDDLNAAAIGAAFGEIVDRFDARESAGGVEAAIGPMSRSTSRPNISSSRTRVARSPRLARTQAGVPRRCRLNLPPALRR